MSTDAHALLMLPVYVGLSFVGPLLGIAIGLPLGRIVALILL